MNTSEHTEQVHVMLWADYNARGLYADLELLHATPNGGLRNLTVAKKLKAEGVKAGVPDLHLPVARGGYHSLWIEMKRVALRPKRGGKGGVSDKQQWWIDKLRDAGHRVEVCYGSKEAICVLGEYLRS